MRTGYQGMKRRVWSDGQSIVEAVVVLALVAILVVTVLRGVGQRTASQLQLANDALEEQAVASATGAGNGGGGNGSAPGSSGDAGQSSGTSAGSGATSATSGGGGTAGGQIGR